MQETDADEVGATEEMDTSRWEEGRGEFWQGRFLLELELEVGVEVERGGFVEVGAARVWRV